MGPQLYRCGNSADAQGALPGRVASMGPQLYRCGNFLSDQRRISPMMGFNGAATLSLRKFTWLVRGLERICMLQWGRNFIVAEMAPWGR